MELHPLLDGHLTLVAKRWVSEVMRKPDRSKQRGDASRGLAHPVEDSFLTEADANAARQVRDLVRVCQAGADGIVIVHREDLRLVGEAPDRSGKQDPVVVALECRAG